MVNAGFLCYWEWCKNLHWSAIKEQDVTYKTSPDYIEIFLHFICREYIYTHMQESGDINYSNVKIQ